MKNTFLYKKLRKYSKDTKGLLVYKVDLFLQDIYSLICSVWMSMITKVWGIESQGNNKYYGVVHFKRFPLSEIKIDEGCIFRSKIRSNFVGLNHPCCISTHSQGAEIYIGKMCGFSGVSISAYQSVKLGEHVLCGANTTITDFDWHPVKSTGQMASSPVVIRDNVWLGMNCVVLKGVSIGENTIVGANSVVTSSLPSNVIAAGNPAQIILKL